MGTQADFWEGREAAETRGFIAPRCLCHASTSIDPMDGVGVTGEVRSGVPFSSCFLPSMHAAVAGRVLGDRFGRRQGAVLRVFCLPLLLGIKEWPRRAVPWSWELGGGFVRAGMGCWDTSATSKYYFFRPGLAAGFMNMYYCLLCTLSLFVGYTASLISYSTLCRAYSI